MEIELEEDKYIYQKREMRSMRQKNSLGELIAETCSNYPPSSCQVLDLGILEREMEGNEGIGGENEREERKEREMRVREK